LAGFSVKRAPSRKTHASRGVVSIAIRTSSGRGAWSVDGAGA